MFDSEDKTTKKKQRVKDLWSDKNELEMAVD